MVEEFVEPREPTPKLYSRGCKTVSLFLRLILQYGAVTTTLVVWYMYDFFIALLTLVLVFIIMGIIRSKLRNSVIPLSQREFHYSDKEIADWYAAKMICHEVE
ncbi:MAG: hypothetical protein WCY51_04025 [Sulfurimonas sp.]|uniref:hypothetical protein n=1 Tax=Sulfurimonas sp. TaxID=2022749 RepID=UPI0025EDA118|nr:hypothetical protein [Sulfurimonas sp.]MCK9454204.1 hypothetical protein [Sulfurimonas sp.]